MTRLLRISSHSSARRSRATALLKNWWRWHGCGVQSRRPGVSKNSQPSRNRFRLANWCARPTSTRQSHGDAARHGKARTAYEDFFTLWKDADPDIPVLKEAKAEYAKLP